MVNRAVGQIISIFNGLLQQHHWVYDIQTYSTSRYLGYRVRKPQCLPSLRPLHNFKRCDLEQGGGVSWGVGFRMMCCRPEWPQANGKIRLVNLIKSNINYIIYDP